MKLYCRSGKIVATHADDQDIPAKTYNAIMPDEAVDAAYVIAVSDRSTFNAGDLEPEITPEFLTTTKDMAKHRVVVEADKLADLITGQVPRGERDSWSTKAQAARDHQDGTAKAWQTVMIQTEADLRGEPIDVLAAKIIAAASSYETISAKIAAQRSSAFTAIDAAMTPTEIEATLTAAQTAALEILAAVQAG